MIKSTQEIQKISANNAIARAIGILLLVIPLFFIVFILFLTDSFKLLLTSGYLIFIIFYLFITYIHLHFSVLDWDLFVSKGQINLKRVNKGKTIRTNNIKIDSLGLISIFLLVFRLKVNKENYLIKLVPESFSERINPDRTTKRYENLINRILSDKQLLNE